MVLISTPEAMFELGRSIGPRLRAGDVLVLNGALGAGKTLLTQGIGDSIGITDITSPTFVICRIHKGTLPLIHVDAYRLLQSKNSFFSLDDLDIDSQRDGAITIVEWGGDLAARLSDERLEISIDRTRDVRELKSVGFGRRWEHFTL